MSIYYKVNIYLILILLLLDIKVYSLSVLPMHLCVEMTKSEGFSIFSTPPLFSSIWYGPRSARTSLFTRIPESLHFAFVEAVDSDICLLKSLAES